MFDMTIIICIVVPFLLISFGMFVSTFLFALRAEKTTGIVIGYNTKRGSRGGNTSAEVVEFTGPDGKKVQFTEKTYRSRFIMNTGHSVEVIYDADNPSKARINSFFALYITPLILFIVGIVLLIFNLPAYSDVGADLLKKIQEFIEKVPFL